MYSSLYAKRAYRLINILAYKIQYILDKIRLYFLSIEKCLDFSNFVYLWVTIFTCD